MGNIIGSRGIIKSFRNLYDPELMPFFAAVEAQDGQPLETALKDAINTLVVGCKSDPSSNSGVSNWQAMKQVGLLCGARSFNGALIQLKGSSITNFGFESEDYNRKTGLLGDGTSKYLNSNRLNTAEAQNNQHVSVFLSTTANTSFAQYIGAGINDGDATRIGRFTNTSGLYFLSRSAVNTTTTGGLSAGFLGLSRNNSSNYAIRYTGTNQTITATSNTPINQNIMVFASINSSSVITTYANARISFFSIGEAVDLALLDARVTEFMNTLAALNLT